MAISEGHFLGAYDLNDWQSFKEKEVEARELLLLSHILVEQRCSMNILQTCLNLSTSDLLNVSSMHEDELPAVQVEQRNVHKILYVWWKKVQLKVKWETLLSCIETLENSLAITNAVRGEIFEGTHDQVTREKHEILIREPTQESNSNSCEFLEFVYSYPVKLHLSDSDHEEDSVIHQSNDQVVSKSLVFYKKLLHSTPNSIVSIGKDGVVALSDPDLARVKGVRMNMKKHQRSFASLLRKAYVALHSTSAEGLSVFLAELCADIKGSIPFFEKRALAIFSRSTIEEIFLLLSEMGAWDFINCEILESVISEFKLEKLNQPMTEHMEKIATFMDETALSDYLTVWDGSREMRSLTDRAPVIAKLKGEWGKYTLADVAEKKCNLASGFRLKPIVLQFEKAAPGCVYIVWSVPLAAAAHMQNMMESSDRPTVTADLAKYGIEELVIGDKLNKICRNDESDVYEELYLESIHSPENFWQKMALRFLQWIKPFESVNSSDFKTGSIQWFKGGQLNVSVNCLDRHVPTESSENERCALIWWNQTEPVCKTYRELLSMTCQVANVLKSKGVTKGDCVAIYMSAIPLAVASMLACTRIGAVHCVIFPAYRQQVLKQRLKDVGVKVIITMDEANTYFPLSEVDAVLNSPDSNDSKPTTVLVVQTSKNPGSLKLRSGYSLLEEEMKCQPPVCTPEPMDSEDLLCVVYSSGTGREDSDLKPLYLTQAGYLVYSTLAHKYIFNCTSDDTFCCLAGLGWLAGQNSVVYGPLANGGTTVLFDDCPYGKRCLEMIRELNVTHLYTVPEVYKHLSTLDDSEFQNRDFPSLRVIATAGDVMPPDVETWCFDKLGKGRCLFIDTYGQTELGGTVFVRAKGKRPLHFPRTKDSFPFFGVTISVSRKVIERDAHKTCDSYELCIDNYTNLPSIARNVIEIHPNSFEGSRYSTHDVVTKPKQETSSVGLEGYWISGRVDDPIIEMNSIYWGISEVENHVTNTVNHQIGEMNVPKVNSVIVLPSVSGQNDLYVWVAMVSSKDELEVTAPEVVSAVDSDLKELFEVQNDLPPRRFVFTNCIPKTLSGKRMNSALSSLSKTLFEYKELWKLSALESVENLKTLRAPCNEIKSLLESLLDDHNRQNRDALCHSESMLSNSMFLQHVDNGRLCRI